MVFKHVGTVRTFEIILSYYLLVNYLLLISNGRHDDTVGDLFNHIYYTLIIVLIV